MTLFYRVILENGPDLSTISDRVSPMASNETLACHCTSFTYQSRSRCREVFGC